MRSDDPDELFPLPPDSHQQTRNVVATTEHSYGTTQRSSLTLAAFSPASTLSERNRSCQQAHYRGKTRNTNNPPCCPTRLPHAMPPRRAKSQSISSDTQSPTPRSSKVPMSAAKTKIPSQNKRPSSPVAATANAISASAGAAAAAAKTAAPSPSAPVLAQGSFPLVVLLSFSLSSLLFTIVAQVTAGDLAAISQHAESWVEISGLLGWKVVQLGVCWFGGFGGVYASVREACCFLADDWRFASNF